MRQKIKSEWSNSPCIVAAPGPSLNDDIASQCYDTGWNVLVVQDAYRLMPWADVLYGCDARWWNAHKGCMDFAGDKWSTHSKESCSDNKIEVSEKYGLNLVKGEPGPGFSTNPSVIHYGDNSGHQGLNLAILLGSPYIVLVGFDMRHVSGKSHFFGDHPSDLFQRAEYESFVKKFKDAPEGVTIINATPDSALKCYEMLSLEDAIENHRLHRYRSVNNSATG